MTLASVVLQQLFLGYAYQFLISVLENFVVVACAFSVFKNIAKSKVRRFTLFSEDFIALFTFRFVMHIELLFVYSACVGGGVSTHILLHLVIQLSPHHVLKILLSLPLNCLGILIENRLTINVRVYSYASTSLS